jgi:hypothetical protein
MLRGGIGDWCVSDVSFLPHGPTAEHRDQTAKNLKLTNN